LLLFIIYHQGHTKGEYTSTLNLVNLFSMPSQGNCQNGMQALGYESYSSGEKSYSESLLNLFYMKYFH